ncbi:hypothetical protein [Sediminibacterium ginsengisoli]|uniref:Uncharacterized protein n=1 Tax=Sediminibacterium ginsengisoli TaxID=413434 RepID=A0A1T4NY78_9BACT|nr:hypothetical protein [Sediminibacterium ginsengisoli]SJZ84203.1 hypothetical protein SAMN04488132_10552 [Sediminibacterium ginsengisoli]
MKKPEFLLRVAMLWLLASTLFLSCRKMDITRTSEDVTKEKFFTNHRSGDATETALITFLQRKNETKPFIGQTVANIGYPRWDKMMKKGAKMSRISVNGSGIQTNLTQSGSNGDVYYIPFARDSQNNVNAIMIIKTSQTDTTISYACDWQYKGLLYSDPSKSQAQKFALSFMMFDKIVFGHTDFRVTDKSLFSNNAHPDANSISLRIGKKEGMQTVKTDMMYYSENCEDVTIFFTNCPYIREIGYCAGPNGSCDRCPSCPSVQMDLTFCYGQWLDDGLGGESGGNGGGGSGGDGSGGSGGGSGPPPNPCEGGGNNNDSKNDVLQEKIKLSGVDPNDPCAPGWEPGDPDPEPDPEPQMTIAEKAIFDQIDAEDNADDNIIAGGCHGTNRTGNIQWPGTLEHWIIMYNYVVENPIAGEVEFKIPGASSTGSGYPGYADIANTLTGEMFEIKPDGLPGLTRGRAEIQTYVTLANQNCAMSPNAIAPAWQKGFNYTTKYYQAKRPNEYLEASLAENGVIFYRYIPKNTVPNIVPVTFTQSNLVKLARLAQKLTQNLSNTDAVIAEFFRDPDNASLLNYIKAAGYGVAAGIIVGTIIQDIATFGGGIVDDWASFTMAYRIIRFVKALH